MNQYKIKQAFPGYAVGDIVDTTKFNDKQLSDTAFFTPYDPDAPWTPNNGDTVWTFDKDLNVLSGEYIAAIETAGNDILTRIIVLKSVGLVFPDQATAESALQSLQSNVATLTPTNAEVAQPPKLMESVEPITP